MERQIWGIGGVRRALRHEMVMRRACGRSPLAHALKLRSQQKRIQTRALA